MLKIGLISDTHSFLDEKVFQYFAECDEIWHAGDIGDPEVLEKLSAFKPTRAVFGNIDEPKLRQQLPEDLLFNVDGLSVFMTHIAGKPPTYTPRVRKLIDQHQPRLFICGHSHILRVMPDPKRPNLLYINPGAAGQHGFHTIRTIMRFGIAEGKIQRPEVIELGKRGALTE